MVDSFLGMASLIKKYAVKALGKYLYTTVIPLHKINSYLIYISRGRKEIAIGIR